MKIKIISLIGLIGLIGIIGGAQQAPEFIVTWQANSYVPSGYKGKIMPTQGTPVSIAFEVIDNGKVADLSRSTIRWYVDDKLQAAGANLKNFNFVVSNFPGQGHILRINVLNYRNTNLEKTVFIPTARPEIVIQAPYPSGLIPAGLNTFNALPYFFNAQNIGDLILVWTANGIAVGGIEGEGLDILELDISNGRSGDIINLQTTAANKINPAELATQEITLQIK